MGSHWCVDLRLNQFKHYNKGIVHISGIPNTKQAITVHRGWRPLGETETTKGHRRIEAYPELDKHGSNSWTHSKRDSENVSDPFGRGFCIVFESCVFVSECGHTPAMTDVWQQKDKLTCWLSPPTFFATVFTGLACPRDSRGPPVSTSHLAIGARGLQGCIWLYLHSGDLNSGPYAFAASPVPTELSSQPHLASRKTKIK